MALTNGKREGCPWCEDGWITRVRACPCRAPEQATAEQRFTRALNANHDPACDDGWVYVKVRCEYCQEAPCRT